MAGDSKFASASWAKAKKAANAERSGLVQEKPRKVVQQLQDLKAPVQIEKNVPIPGEVTPKTKLSLEEYNIYLNTSYLKGVLIEKIYGPESFTTPLVQPSLTQSLTIQGSSGIGTLSTLPKESSTSTLFTPQVAAGASDPLSKVGVSGVHTLSGYSGRLHQPSTSHTPPGAVGGVGGEVKPQHKAKQDPVSQVTEQLGKIKVGEKPKQDVMKKEPEPKSKKKLGF